jgi:hypothetical protein
MSSHVIRNEADKCELSKAVLALPLRKPKKVTIETYDQRTADQNAQQWPYLFAFSEQKQWWVNGEPAWLSPDDWKDVLTASYKEEKIKASPTLSGNAIVMLGLRTSKFDVDEWPDWMAFLKWAAADNEIKVPISKRQMAMYQ